MGWQLPPLNALRAFEAAGRLSSFTLAAEELHVTPGAVSRQIKLLEATLGIPLFIRNNREVRLTPESALYLNSLTESFRRMDAATGSLRDARRDRPLRIMCSGNVATRWLFSQLREFHTRYPNRHVLLTTSLTSASVAFDSDMTDILIRLGQAPWPSDIVAHRLFKSNAEQIEKIRRIMEEFDIHYATPQEARQRLGLPHPAPQVAPMAV
jgi:LysR family glycine cleavage system transcriptional activator